MSRHTIAEDERFFSRTVVPADPSECWNWMAGKSGAGYGLIVMRGQRMYAHRWSYWRFIGDIPDGLTIDHLCRNKVCVNFRHLEAVTLGENILRSKNPCAINARKTECLNGHPLTDENVYPPSSTATGPERRCRLCAKARRDARKVRVA